jgi:hypothetical protein
LYRQVHAALKNGWLHRAHHQQAELQSKQVTPILGEMITAAYALAAAAAEGRFPVKIVAVGVSLSKCGGAPARASAEAEWSAKQGLIHALVEAISPPLDCTDTIDLPRKKQSK